MSGHSRQRKSRGSKAAGPSSRRPGPDSRPALTGLEQLPNVGPAVAGYLRRLAVTGPQDLVGRDPYAMYDELCRVTGRRLDPCLLDTFIAAVRFMAGEPARPWWTYTAERKREMEGRRRDQGAG